MAGKTVEKQLRIRAIDDYSKHLDGMRTATGRFSSKVRQDFEGLRKLRGPMKLIEDFRKVQSELQDNGRALDKAKSKLRGMQAALIATDNPSREMRQNFSTARREVVRLERALSASQATLQTTRSAMADAGINASNLASEQRRLAQAFDSANPAFERRLDRMKRLQEMQGRIAGGRARMDRGLATAANVSFVGGASMQAGRGIFQAIRSPVQTAIEFESAMADVRKVVDFKSPDGFKQMSKDIMEMSTRIPMAGEGLAQIVAAGGQSGLAEDELLTFAEMAAKIGVAFDVSADTAGTSMAKIKTALGLNLDETGLVFDAINHLSNNMASEAPNVLEFTRRVAVEGEVAGFDPTQTIGFGSAMIAAGAQSDVAATSFRNMANALTRGKSATNTQIGAMRALGLDTVDVANRMQKDAVGTTLDVLKRINEKIPKAARKAVISDIFGNEARALTPLIDKMELLEQALGYVADQEKYQGSAEKEYQARADTTAYQLKITQGHFNQLGNTIGSVVLPPLNDFLTLTQKVIKRMTQWAEEHPKLTKAIVMGGAAIGAMAMAGGALLTAGAGLIGTFAVLRFGLVGLSARVAFAIADFVGLRGAVRGLFRLPKFRFASLIKPLKWTAKLLPNFAPALARFAAFRIAATAQMAALSSSALWHSSLIGGAFAKGFAKWLLKGGAIGTGLALGLGIKPTANGERSEEEEQKMAALSKEDKQIEELKLRAQGVAGSNSDPSFWERIGIVGGPPQRPMPKSTETYQPAGPRTRPVLRRPPQSAVRMSLRPVAPPTALQKQLKLLEQQIEAIERIKRISAKGPLPTGEHIATLQLNVNRFKQAIATLEAQQAALTPGEQLGAKGQHLENQLDARRAALKQMEANLAAAQAQASELEQQLQVVSQTEVAPVVTTASIDEALQKAVLLASTLENLPSGQSGKTPVPGVAGARARGGPVRGGLPYLVNEDTPRSEVFVPSQSGGILNVAQAQSVLRSHLPSFRPPVVPRSAYRIREASLAALAATVTAVAPPAAAAPVVAPEVAPVNAGKAAVRDVKIDIGQVTIPVPAGVSDPAAIAKLAAQELHGMIAADLSASFSD